MAEGLLNQIAPDMFEAFSAGADATYVHPLAIKVMSEIGIDISGHESKSVDVFAGREFDVVITVCVDSAKDACPVFVGAAGRRLSWQFDDPATAPVSDEQKPDVFRRARDEIRSEIEKFALSESG